MDNHENVLCLKGQEKNYLMSLQDMVEICIHVKISQIPCLPQSYLGVFHYKGEMLPVLKLEDQQESLDDAVVLVVENNGCRFGILIHEEPLLLNQTVLTCIETKQDFFSGIWYISHLYQNLDELYYFVNIPKTIEFLVENDEQ